MEHLRVAGLIAGAVIQEILHLLLALGLAFQPAGIVEALRARHRGDDAREIGELLRREAHDLVAGLRRLERAACRLAGGYQRADLRLRVLEILHHARLDVHRILIAGARVLPARLRVGEHLRAGCP
jgi:hypothetical protein